MMAVFSSVGFVGVGTRSGTAAFSFDGDFSSFGSLAIDLVDDVSALFVGAFSGTN